VSCDWLFVDGSSLIFRAFYGVKGDIRSPDGRRVNAVRGFLDNLARLVTDRRPGRLAVASDEDWRPAWRFELIPTYKSHRTAEPVPRELEPQMPVIHDFLDAFGIDFVGYPDHEAEDVIATWTAQVSEGTVEIVSGDRDLFALVEDARIKVLYPEKGGLAVVDEAEVERRYGIPGRAYADFAVLRGDPSDGLPAWRGGGPAARRPAERRRSRLPGASTAGGAPGQGHPDPAPGGPPGQLPGQARAACRAGREAWSAELLRPRSEGPDPARLRRFPISAGR